MWAPAKKRKGSEASAWFKGGTSCGCPPSVSLAPTTNSAHTCTTLANDHEWLTNGGPPCLTKETDYIAPEDLAYRNGLATDLCFARPRTDLLHLAKPVEEYNYDQILVLWLPPDERNEWGWLHNQTFASAKGADAYVAIGMPFVTIVPLMLDSHSGPVQVGWRVTNGTDRGTENNYSGWFRTRPVPPLGSAMNARHRIAAMSTQWERIANAATGPYTWPSVPSGLEMHCICARDQHSAVARAMAKAERQARHQVHSFTTRIPSPRCVGRYTTHHWIAHPDGVPRGGRTVYVNTRSNVWMSRTQEGFWIVHPAPVQDGRFLPQDPAVWDAMANLQCKCGPLARHSADEWQSRHWHEAIRVCDNAGAGVPCQCPLVWYLHSVTRFGNPWESGNWVQPSRTVQITCVNVQWSANAVTRLDCHRSGSHLRVYMPLAGVTVAEHTVDPSSSHQLARRPLLPASARDTLRTVCLCMAQRTRTGRLSLPTELIFTVVACVELREFGITRTSP